LPTPVEINERLDSVLTTLYLLYSEGYYSESRDNLIRKDLCLEAMRLTLLLTKQEITNRPDVNALLALMSFHASRFDARRAENGDFLLYNDQDKDLWNQDLIAQGVYFLHQASRGNHLSKYHLEATIAYLYTTNDDTGKKWEQILDLLDQRLLIDLNPVAALNRIYVISKIRGKQEALIEIAKWKVPDNQFYHALMSELFRGIDHEQSNHHFQKALSKSKTEMEKNMLRRGYEENGINPESTRGNKVFRKKQ
jgi:RNA polymerase sigma-70 factor (ECF subfamily)